jgi:hypothetical protein
MEEQLLNLIKESAQDAVVNNPEVPNDKNEAVMQEAASSITGGLKQALAGGGFQDVLKTLGGKADATGANPVVQNISGGFIDNLMKKFGLSSQTAQSIASSLIPMVIGKLVHKTNDPGDSNFSLGSIFGSLTGGKSSGLNLEGMLQSLGGGGLDKDHDGDVDFNDVTQMISGAVSGQGSQGGGVQGGGILDSLKGMLGGK